MLHSLEEEVIDSLIPFPEILPGQQPNNCNSITFPFKDCSVIAYPQAIYIFISFEFLDMLTIWMRICFESQTR